MKLTNTPDKNCNATKGRFTIAAADLAFFGTLDMAIPSSEHAMAPSTVTQPKVSHRDALVGSFTP